ncbi:GTP-binding protein SAR1B [Diplonema papillatum]|nr:GTP-binding protein SAR1B [Diplonema papillatum]
MGWFDWLSQTLRFLGLSSKKGKILFLGLDNAGKTTLLGKMKNGKIGSFKPTNHPNKEEFAIGSINFTAFDLGGHEQARLLWKQYFTKVDGVVYIFDASETDPNRVAIAKEALNELLKDDMLLKVPFVILGNKIDAPNAMSEGDLKATLGIDSLCTGRKPSEGKPSFRPLEVFMCSIVEDVGFGEAFRWLSSYLDDA